MYSCGNTLTNFGSSASQLSRIRWARGLPVKAMVAANQVLNCGSILRLERFEIHAGTVAARRAEFAGFIQHIGDASGHAGGEIPARWPKHNDGSPRHILAAVIAHSFDDGRGSRIPHGESLAGHAVEKGLAAGGAIQDHIADDDAFFRAKIWSLSADRR